MELREIVDHRGISHLVEPSGKCRTFEGCRQHSPIREPEDMSPQALRAELRNMRIQNLILERKLAAAERKIEQLKASGPLASLLVQDEEPVCP